MGSSISLFMMFSFSFFVPIDFFEIFNQSKDTIKGLFSSGVVLIMGVEER